ncbi:hypothetical protein E4P38_22580 [Blastococcus sp. CT_GayMR16]|nr:hypothetical protein E4P38_22580 [Blastococcus sp. CT_GayMR16]
MRSACWPRCCRSRSAATRRRPPRRRCPRTRRKPPRRRPTAEPIGARSLCARPAEGHHGPVSGAPWVLVHLAGPLRVDRGGTPLAGAELGSRKGRTLLRLLAARRGDVLPGAEIAAVLWPRESPSDPDAVVASLVSRLRRVLGPNAVVGGREGYRLGAVEVDVDRARQLLADAERAAPAPAGVGAGAALELLGAAEGSPEPDDEWMAPVRSEVTVLRRRAHHLLARTALETGEPAGAEDAAGRALADDPLDEEAVRLLMRALLARDLPAEALRTYERLRRALADELGTDPAPATRTLYDAALHGEAPVVSAVPPPADRLRLAGRDAELGLLRAEWEGACGHRAGLVLLTGEPGIGKSRLLEELAETARRSGGVVLSGRAFEGERSVFAQPLVDALASAAETLPAARIRAAATGDGTLGRLVPELAPFTDAVPVPPAPTPAVERSQSFAAVTGFLRRLARGGPVLVAVDDLQRAGRSTIELLHYLARHLGSAQVLLAAAVRTGEGDDVVEPLRAVGTTVPLGPLPVDAVALLAGRAGHESRAADVMRRTGGHPLFVVEVLRALARGDGGLPTSLQTAVVDRVAGTGEETGRLMRAAAVLGAAFDPLVAGELAGIGAAAALPAFERAFKARLLVARGRQYEFAHDVVREALLVATPSPTLQAWHARAADLLSADPEAVARHAEAIGDRPRAARAWLNAAEAALARFVASDAILLATRAAAIAADLEDAPDPPAGSSGPSAAAPGPRTTTRRPATAPTG